MPDVLICPYCHEEQYTHEPDDADAVMCLTECEHCGKSFWYSVTVRREYSASKEEDEEEDDEDETNPEFE